MNGSSSVSESFMPISSARLTTFARTDEGTKKAAKKGQQILVEESDNPNPSSPITQTVKHNPYRYHFPENTKIILNSGQSVDISNIDIDLSCIFRGGIGWGGGASKLLSRAMCAIGCRGAVNSLPFCVEGSPTLPSPFNKLILVSIEDKEVTGSIVQDRISQLLKHGFSFINIPLNVSGHASLASFIFVNDEVEIRFYDSMSPKDLAYDQRYSEPLIDFLKSLLPDSFNLKTDQPKVLHLLYQGDKDSLGCGYYTTYTALLLKERDGLINLESYDGPPLLDNSHDMQIRAELVVKTLLEYGLEKVDLSFETLINQTREGIFSRIDFELEVLVKALRPKLFN